MIEAKESLVGNISQTQEINGNINKEVVIIEPKLQEKEATPTEQTQIITPDTNFDGISKMTINSIPSEYIVPSGTLNITQNGEYNVKNYETANVATSGVDINDYFESTISEGTSGTPGFLNMVKNIPSTTTVSGTSLIYSFRLFKGTTISLIDTSNVTNMQYMFQESPNLTTIPLLNTSNVTNMGSMFKNCSNFTTIPLLDTSKITNMSNMFQNCPNLTDASLDNILQMCIRSNITNASRKNLAYIGFTSTNYSTARIQALPHYQDFINAGWTIGY